MIPVSDYNENNRLHCIRSKESERKKGQPFCINDLTPKTRRANSVESTNVNNINPDYSQVSGCTKELQLEEITTNLITPKLERLLPVGIIVPEKG